VLAELHCSPLRHCTPEIWFPFTKSCAYSLLESKSPYILLMDKIRPHEYQYELMSKVNEALHALPSQLTKLERVSSLHSGVGHRLVVGTGVIVG